MITNQNDTDFTVEQHSSRGRIGQAPPHMQHPDDSHSSFAGMMKTLPNDHTDLDRSGFRVESGHVRAQGLANRIAYPEM